MQNCGYSVPVDDKKKGGDYDFLIETSLTNPDEINSRKIDMIAQLQSSEPFEDEKIDIIVKRQHSSFEMPIYSVAKHEGVQLRIQSSQCVYISLNVKFMRKCLIRAW